MNEVRKEMASIANLTTTSALNSKTNEVKKHST